MERKFITINLLSVGISVGIQLSLTNMKLLYNGNEFLNHYGLGNYNFEILIS
jgi:hypothetical protein